MQASATTKTETVRGSIDITITAGTTGDVYPNQFVSGVGKRFSTGVRGFQWVMQSAKTFYSLHLARLRAKPSLWPAPGRAALESWVNRYGMNSTSYVLLEGPKRYFTSPRVDGFLAYQVRANIAVIGGDPVCPPGQAEALIKDFVEAMRKCRVGAYQVSPNMRDAFREAGFKDIQIGKEAIFDLRRFSLAGGQMELVRAATNKARREGVVVSEHRPFALDAKSLNDELRTISAEWLRSKGEHEFGFLLGSLGLEQRSAKRYFIARSGRGAGRIEGFIVCEPIYGRNGYYLDVTRRRLDAVRGTMELLTTETFRLLNGEGYEMASMGLAPLALLDDPDLSGHPRLTGLMRFVYQRVHNNYDFKLLYRYKAKYHPHAWEPRYFCFNQKRLTLQMAYAVIQVRNALSVGSLFRRNPRKEKGFQGKVRSWKHAASFVVGLCSALLSSTS
jgi:phosphatidylglycerol lysyltransferase